MKITFDKYKVPNNDIHELNATERMDDVYTAVKKYELITVAKRKKV